MKQLTQLTVIKIIICFLLATVLGYFGYIRFFRAHGPSNKLERTLAIIKPDAVKAHNTGKIIDKIEQSGFTIVDLKKVTLDREQAEKFYQAHHGKKFFAELVDFMVGGPIVVMILEKVNAISQWRDLMGTTDPEKAADGTIRKIFGTNVGKNAVHGSDSEEAAQKEIRFFFADRIHD